MQSKFPLITIDKSAQCHEALHLMAKNQLHHLVVTENDHPIGVLNDRDVFYHWGRGAFLTRSDFESFPIETITRTHLPIVTKKTTLSEVVRWMKNLGTSALLSQTNDNQWSIITESDLLMALDQILEKKQWPEQLLAEGESQLASPLVQKLMEMLGQMGI